jgi:3-oxoadipate enol-lactonase
LFSGVSGVDCLVTGVGSPVSLFLPGLGGSIGQLRVLGGGVPGTRVFCELSADAPDDYPGLAAAFRTVADRFGADRALGASLGAGALLRLLTETPDRFARLVLYTPSAFGVVPPARRDQLAAMLRLAEVGDTEGVAALLVAELPPEVRETRPARDSCAVRAERLARPEALRLLKNLTAGAAPVGSVAALAAVTARALVVAAAGDPVHPVGVAEAIAAALPYAELSVFDSPGPPWSSRRELRGLLSAFLGAPD